MPLAFVPLYRGSDPEFVLQPDDPDAPIEAAAFRIAGNFFEATSMKET